MDRGLTETQPSSSVRTAPHAPEGASLPSRLASLVRYRFFLYAGLLPYLLGAAWAYGVEHQFNAGIFWLGFLGIFLSVVGVESFNEYFDARMGTDRVFNPSDDEYIPEWMFWLGVGAFAVAASIGFYLAWEGGWPIAVYTLLGGLAAIFYVGPPIRWVYRGLGETAIGLSYGPWMTLGSLELYTHRFSWPALAASLVPGFLITGLAVVNEIPDFYQDRLVGKRNLVVRLGRRNGVFLYAGFAVLGLLTPCVGAWAGIFPRWTPLAALAGLPLLILSVKHALKTWDSPKNFISAIKYIVLCYLAATAVFTLAVMLP